MTIEERNTKLKYFIVCIKCRVHGIECNDNCPVQYEAGNMGEIIENLETISKALEQELKPGHWIAADGISAICSCCNRLNHLYGTYCKFCGAKMSVLKGCE